MKKTTVLIMLILSLLFTGMAAGQGLPFIGNRPTKSAPALPDPGPYLNTVGNEFEKDYSYNGVVYNTYLYAAPENEGTFVTEYYLAAIQAGFEPELSYVEQQKAILIYGTGRSGDPALLLYDYQGYVLFMVPLDMNFSLGTENTAPRPTEAVRLPTSTPKPTAKPQPAATARPKPADIPAIPGMTIDENGVLTKYCGTSADVVIPNGVVFIDNFAFSDLTDLRSVVIPDSVVAIGDYAFSDCTNLKTVDISGGVISIGSSAFYNCKSLKNVSLAQGISFIGESAFNNCASLESIDIPGSVISIGGDAFYGCEKLKTVMIREGVKIIASYAFLSCDSLADVTLPASIISIGTGAFTSMSRNKTYHVRAGTYAAYWAEGSSSSGKEIAGFEIDEYGNLLKYSGKDSYIVIPDNVTMIKSFAFDECLNAKTIVIQEGVVSIESYAFSNCSNLESVVLPDSVLMIGENAFLNCTALKSVEFGDGLAYLGDSAFSMCSKLGSVNIPDSVIVIGRNAFEDCTGIRSLSIGNGVKYIGQYAFNDCSQLKSVSIPDSIRYLANRAFPRDTAIDIVSGQNRMPSPRTSWTATPMPTRTPTRPPAATKTPTPRPTYNLNAGYEKYVVSGAGIYGFQIRPYANTEWLFKEQYQHPVYNGDIVYFTGSKQMGLGYDGTNIQWMSVRTEDGFTGWLPAYILKKAR